LQPQEYRLLEYLMRHADRVVTRTMLLEGVWGFHFDPKTSVVETHISRLRSKLDRDGETPVIKTIRGAGYMVNAGA
jgi:two-component system, OmpR family, response regulator